jgi:hypothetical protein
MKRFTNDIIRILKNKPQRSMAISEIPIEYGMINYSYSNYNQDRFLEMAYKKPFCVTDFGMCHLEDLVNEVKDNKELVVEADKDIIKLYRKGKIEDEIRC